MCLTSSKWLTVLLTGAPYRSCSQLFYDIIQKEGARNLMKGLMPRLVAVPSMMSTFYVIDEELKKLFGYT